MDLRMFKGHRARFICKSAAELYVYERQVVDPCDGSCDLRKNTADGNDRVVQTGLSLFRWVRHYLRPHAEDHWQFSIHTVSMLYHTYDMP